MLLSQAHVNLADDVIINIAIFIGIVPLAMGMFRWKSLSHSQKQMMNLLVVIVTIQLIASATINLFNTGSNLPLYHFYTLIEGVGLVLVLSRRLVNFIPRIWFVGVAIIFGLFTLFNAFYLQRLDQLPTIARAAEAIMMIVMSLLYFYRLLDELQIKRIERSFWFWLNLGILLYFSTNFLLFLYNNLFLNEPLEMLYEVWGWHALLTILLYLIYSIALLCKDPTS